VSCQRVISGRGVGREAGREREQKRKAGGSQKRKGFPLQCGLERTDVPTCQFIGAYGEPLIGATKCQKRVGIGCNNPILLKMANKNGPF